MIPLSHYLILGAILFAISVVGIFLNRKNVVILLMSIELLLQGHSPLTRGFDGGLRRLAALQLGLQLDDGGLIPRR